MPGIVELIKTDRKIRNISILTLISVILGCILVYRIVSAPEPVDPGANRVVICRDCGNVEVMRVNDINDPELKCSKCGGRVAIAWKCNKCKYQYYIAEQKFNTKNMKTMQRFQKVVESRRCPNCGETRDTRPMTIKDMEKQ